MSYYNEPQAWQAPVRQPSWEQPPPPSRSGASSTSQREENYAFVSQIEEVDRAIDNLVKSGKFFVPGSRRDSMPMMIGGGRYGDHEPRMPGNRHSVSDFDPARSHSASNLQNFYASQRYQSRPSEAEQMMQAKRRMAAQRERELRNYHQEQQYNRSGSQGQPGSVARSDTRPGVLAEMSSNKSDRSMSPSTMSEEGRRELIARQHRALYGSDGAGFMPQGGFSDDGSNRDPSSAAPASSGGMRGNSPRGMDPFGMGQPAGQSATGDNNGQGESVRIDAGSQPVTGTAPSFAGFEGSSQQGKTSPAGGESPSRGISKATTAPIGGGMGPIGSRPAQQQPQHTALNKSTTSPLPSQHDSFGFGQPNNNERAGSSNSNSNQKDSGSNPPMGAWGTGSGVWGSSKIGATSVWG